MSTVAYTVDKMSRSSKVLLYLFALLSWTLVQALPSGCAPGDDRCHDRHMHPDLPEEVSSRRALNGENTNDYWREQAKEFVKQKLAATPNTNKAKNVIMFLGDGMGLTTIAAARNLIGGEESKMSFESFPYTGLSKTYSVDKIVPDSACTATAYLGGVKAIEGTIGLNGNVERADCVTMLDTNNNVYSIAKSAMDAGKWAGFVTTTRVTHASPAGLYAHISERDWEDDTEVIDGCGLNSGVQDIAYQLIHGEIGSRLKLMMGGGKKHFYDSSIYENGTRSDSRNLISEYLNLSSKNKFIETRDELMDENLNEADRVLGIFQDSHMLYHLETNEETNQPTLEEMTRVAIEYMSRNDNGYFMFIEGGRIDLAHHDNLARIALDEAVEFSKAIQAARELTSEEDTLIVVTADHSHAFSYSGYPYRGNDIFGKAPATPDDLKPYLTLGYANGPAYEHFYDTENKQRVDPTQVMQGDLYDVFPAAVPLDSETHGGDDVAVYAVGPWSHLFTGVYEQNTIPHMMAYAACLGDGLKSCDA